MHFADSHCHLQDERLAGQLDAVIDRARTAGVSFMVCCGASEPDWTPVADLAAKHAGVFPSFGLHPWYVMKRSPRWLETLRRMLDEHLSAGVGEIGLDHVIGPETFADQLSAFRSQVELAIELRRPVSMHCRRAWGALLETLNSMPGLPRGFVIHSYSGSVETIEPLVKLGAFISFSGSVTLSGNKRAHRSAVAVPSDRLLIETDSPDIMPVIAGTRNEDAPNEPGNLPHIAAAVAALRGVSVEEIAALTVANASRLFGNVQPGMNPPSPDRLWGAGM